MCASYEEGSVIVQKRSRIRKILTHVNQVVCHEENIGTIWETSNGCCVMNKAIHKEVTAGGRFNFFLDSWILPTWKLEPRS